MTRLLLCPRETLRLNVRPLDRSTKLNMQTGMAENSRYCEALLAFSSLTLVVPIGYAFTSMNPMIPVFEAVYNGTYYERNQEPMPHGTMNVLMSFTISFPVLASMIGAIATRPILNYLGPKRSQILLHLFSVLSNVVVIALIGGLTRSYEVIVVGRMMVGLYLAFGLNIASVVVAECCAKKRQPFFQSVLGIGMAFGGLTGPIMGYDKVLGTMQLWPVAISLTSIYGVIWLLLSPFIVDSPYYLMKLGKREEATTALKKLRKGNKIDEEIDAIETELSRAKREGSSQVSLTGMFKTKQYRRIMIAVFLVYANMMLVGVNIVVFFSSQVFLNAGIEPGAVSPATIGVFAGQFLVAIFGSRMVHRFGAKKVSIAGSITMSIGHIIVTASLATLDRVPVMRYLSIVGMIIFMLGWAAGPNLTTFAIVNGVTTIETRATSITYGSVVFWLTGFIVALLPPYLQPILGAYIMVPWFVCTVALMLYQIFFLPDMHNKTEGEIQKYMTR